MVALGLKGTIAEAIAGKTGKKLVRCEGTCHPTNPGVFAVRAVATVGECDGQPVEEVLDFYVVSDRSLRYLTADNLLDAQFPTWPLPEGGC